jgi:ABC-type bacteriocin/lantibiotic exporter with double-glycine peptidase domain
MRFRLLAIIMLISITCFSQQIERQKASNWCWAACVQSIVSLDDHTITQEDIAAELDGWPRNRPANVFEIIKLLKHYEFNAWRAGRPASPQELYRTLSGGDYELIAFVRPSGGQVGHFILLHGIAKDGRIIVSDPAIGRTFTNTIEQLYWAWKWEDAVVVEF